MYEPVLTVIRSLLSSHDHGIVNHEKAQEAKAPREESGYAYPI